MQSVLYIKQVILGYVFFQNRFGDEEKMEFAEQRDVVRVGQLW